MKDQSNGVSCCVLGRESCYKMQYREKLSVVFSYRESSGIGWLRLVGLFYRALLQKRPMILKSLFDLSRSTSTMGRLRLVGSLKVQVSFAEHRFLYRALLQKWPIMLRSLLIVATPYLVGGSHSESERGGGLGSRPIFKKFHETYAPS